MFVLRTALQEDREELQSRVKFLANRYLRGSREHGREENYPERTQGYGLVIVLKGISSLIPVSKARPEQDLIHIP